SEKDQPPSGSENTEPPTPNQPSGTENIQTSSGSNSGVPSGSNSTQPTSGVVNRQTENEQHNRADPSSSESLAGVSDIPQDNTSGSQIDQGLNLINHGSILLALTRDFRENATAEGLTTYFRQHFKGYISANAKTLKAHIEDQADEDDAPLCWTNKNRIRPMMPGSYKFSRKRKAEDSASTSREVKRQKREASEGQEERRTEGEEERRTEGEEERRTEGEEERRTEGEEERGSGEESHEGESNE
ncbi:hypothetical protein BgiMline_014502, partial [Biomphalaria glabrata]